MCTQVVSTALPECKNPESVSVAVKAFMQVCGVWVCVGVCVGGECVCVWGVCVCVVWWCASLGRVRVCGMEHLRCLEDGACLCSHPSVLS